MKRNLCWCLLCLVVLMPLVCGAQGQLPAPIAALAPAGATVSSPTFARTAMFADSAFTADKKLTAGHQAHYIFHLLCHDTNSPLWQMRGPIYQAEMKKKIDAKRESLKAGTEMGVRFDPVKETKYAWGTGFTQRVVHPYIGAGSGPEYVDYRTAYIGMINGSIFELTADGVPTAEEANQWAATVAAKAGVLGVATLGN